MGIDSREYLRDGDDYRQPQSPMSMVTKIIIVTVVVFILQVLSSDANGQSEIFNRWFILRSDGLFSGHVWKLLTYAFLHDTSSLLHIVMNMAILYMMGRVTAQLTGEREFLWFYCMSAIFAGMCSVIFYRFLQVDPGILGASGAVLAVFTLFALHYPRQKLYVFGLLPVEARWLLAAYVIYDAVPMMSAISNRQLGNSTTAHSAHLGGVVFAWLYFSWKMRFTSWWDRIVGRVQAQRGNKAGLRVFNPKSQPEPDLSKRVDEILTKISEQGEESLTARERRILRQASEQLKNRR